MRLRLEWLFFYPSHQARLPRLVAHTLYPHNYHIIPLKWNSTEEKSEKTMTFRTLVDAYFGPHDDTKTQEELLQIHAGHETSGLAISRDNVARIPVAITSWTATLTTLDLSVTLLNTGRDSLVIALAQRGAAWAGKSLPY
ncbi:hypothetical protein NM208_g11623 [Fusarium decemcellulare]|uniref:Uncharacterized protein n=1 Tax=Fusarium decemcellulare TaxID=57161 RepID=A0ACC1RT78_9HYPO|nr:hypothetical protein NM208_g11623 [Fusarium decemcellulare]